MQLFAFFLFQNLHPLCSSLMVKLSATQRHMNPNKMTSKPEAKIWKYLLAFPVNAWILNGSRSARPLQSSQCPFLDGCVYRLYIADMPYTNDTKTQLLILQVMHIFCCHQEMTFKKIYTISEICRPWEGYDCQEIFYSSNMIYDLILKKHRR